MWRAAYNVAATLLLAGVSFAVTLGAGPIFTLVWALAVGALSLWFARLIDGQSGDARVEVTPMLMAGSAMLLAWGFGWLWPRASDAVTLWYDAASVFLALGSAWGLDSLVAGRGKRQCFICKVQIAEPRPISCPRCHQVICAQPSCWISRHLRCRYCDERDVVLFPMKDEPWWKTRLGARVSTGTCSSCFDEAAKSDLRACGQCSWPMCKRCWDYHNGRCVRCEWILPGLPESLRPFLGASGRADSSVHEHGARR
jgi:hypothetical protein